ncbi:tetratricopeptide repeat protein [uncultured Lacinutrix sp.]|uniref:tetratricopeptide repeat protein n=1 Tax=uncultured Lacinutrix sp. TaxID=574032 RepID=UPI00262FE58D|nr:tetratricopeptide repeat protein [uncultured Lacinutrix sp.]
MNFSEDILQNIEDYLNGKMNANEIKTFENQINDNQEFYEAVKINKKLKLQYDETNWDFIEDNKSNTKLNELEALLKSNEFQDKKKAIQTASASYFKNEEVKKLNNNKPKLYYLLAFAAAVIVFLGVFFNDSTSTNQEIYSDNSKWEELPSLVSRSEINVDLLSAGENAFNNKNYVLAKENFTSFINDDYQVNPTALLYLGISQLELENYNEALNSFQKIAESNTLDQSKGYWYRALTYFKMDDRANAIKELEIIVKSSKNHNFEKAKKLLKKLN